MNSKEIEKRKPVWLAISRFYLDTKLVLSDIEVIKATFKDSGFSLEELKNIDFYEVRPIVGANLLDTAGEWRAFDKDWLWNEILTKSLTRKRRNNFYTKWRRKQFETNKHCYWNTFHSEFECLIEL